MRDFPLRAHPRATKDHRLEVLTSTDVRRIMRGEWFDLYLQKTGQKPAPNLDYEWKPRLGLETEKLHAWWHVHTEKVKLIETPDTPMSPVIGLELPDYVAATFDYWCEDDGVPLELKHTNERNDLRSAASYYMAQLQWQMLVAGVGHLRFSIIRGNNEPEWGIVERDDAIIETLLQQAEAFWWHVENGEAPPADEPTGKDVRAAAAKAAKSVPINGLKPYDWSTDNAWVAAAGNYIRDKVGAESLKITEPALRSMIPADASEISGGGLSFKRDARGAYRVSIDEAELEAQRARLRAMGMIDG